MVSRLGPKLASQLAGYAVFLGRVTLGLHAGGVTACGGQAQGEEIGSGAGEDPRVEAGDAGGVSNPAETNDDQPAGSANMSGDEEGVEGDDPATTPTADGGEVVKPSRVQPVAAQPVTVEPTPLAVPTYVPWVDDRASRPEWEPAAPVGEASWQGESSNYCSPFAGRTQVATLRANENGVYFFHSVACQNAEAGVCLERGQSLQINDGTGWKTLLAHNDYLANDFLGVNSQGAAALAWQQGSLCLVRNGELWKLVDLGEPFVASQVEDTDTFYAASSGEWVVGDPEPVSRISVITSEQSALIGTVNGVVRSVWANDHRALFAGWDQLIVEYRRKDGSLRELGDVPVGSYKAVWGVGDDKLWLGNSIGQLVYYDGESWSLIETGVGEPIEQLWGREDVLYFRSSHAFGRVANDGAVDLIVATDSGLLVHSISGFSVSDVFVAIEDPNFKQYECGGLFILRFDGEVMHPI